MNDLLHMDSLIDAIEDYVAEKKRGTMAPCSAHKVPYDTCQYEEDLRHAKLKLCDRLNEYIDERIEMILEKK